MGAVVNTNPISNSLIGQTLYKYNMREEGKMQYAKERCIHFPYFCVHTLRRMQ